MSEEKTLSSLPKNTSVRKHRKKLEKALKELELTDTDVQLDEDSLELKELIKKNIKWTQILYRENKRIKRRLSMMVLGNYSRLAIIVLPIILGIIFIPPLIEEYKTKYKDVLKNFGLGIQGEKGALQVSPEKIQGIIQLLQQK